MWVSIHLTHARISSIPKCYNSNKLTEKIILKSQNVMGDRLFDLHIQNFLVIKDLKCYLAKCIVTCQAHPVLVK